MNEIILILDQKFQDSLAIIRTKANLQCASRDGNIWVRGIFHSNKKKAIIPNLPWKENFTLDDSNRLFPFHSLSPTSVMPQLDWKPIAEFLPISPPISAQPAQITETLSFRLQASNQEKPGYALLTSISIWQNYAKEAPQSRLDLLQYTLSKPDRVLIIGKPLPPISGQEYWLIAKMLLPAGQELEYPIFAEQICNSLNPGQESLLLFDIQGNWEKVSLSQFAPARRSSIQKIES